MSAEKKYYWIKLKNTFMDSDKVDYLMSKTNGAEYVVLYQMLCLKCINTDGLLARQIGEVIIPFDAEKIARDCKYFKVDTVKQAFNLFIQLGMIYQEENGYLRIADFDNLVGSASTDEHTRKLAAERQAKFRAKNNLKLEENSVTVTDDVTLFRNAEKDIRERDKDIDINSKSSAKAETSKKTKSDIVVLKNTWNDCYKKLFNKSPDSNITDNEKKMSFWAGITRQINNALKNKNYDSVTLEAAIRYGALEDWIVKGGFTLAALFSENNITKSMSNTPHSYSNNQPAIFEKKVTPVETKPTHQYTEEELKQFPF